ncbi:MAG: hypothetical protein ACQEQV_05280 [Fibrobacterota bacterium]
MFSEINSVVEVFAPVAILVVLLVGIAVALRSFRMPPDYYEQRQTRETLIMKRMKSHETDSRKEK